MKSSFIDYSSVVSLSDVCELVAGFAFKSKDFGEYPDKVIKIKDIQPPFVNFNDLEGVDISFYDKNKLNKYLVGPNDYILAMTGATIGKIGKICKGIAYINQRVLVFRPKQEICNKDFLYYVLKNNNFLPYIINHIDSESAQPNISATTIGRFSFKLPPISIQNKIAHILASLDAKIMLNTQINRNLEQQAQEILLSCINKNYNLKLGEILSFVNGFSFKSSSYVKNGIFKIITIKNVQDGKIDSNGADSIEYIPEKMKNDCILHLGDILLSLTGNVGRTGIVCEKNLLLNQRVAKIITKKTQLHAAIYFIFRMTSVKTVLETIARGTAQANLSPVETLNISIPFELSVLEKYSYQLTFLFEKIVKNEQENKLLAALCDTLLPKLMSGEIDVSEVEV